MSSIDFTATQVFAKNAKKLSKKYPSFKADLVAFKKSLEKNPNQGTLLSGGFRKIRMAITSKARGKSGGARVITLNCIVSAQVVERIVLENVYDKGDQESISDKEIRGSLNYNQEDKE